MSLAEYFTLARASAEVVKLGAPRRKEIGDALAVGRQRGESAETLWSNGHTAEGLRLAFSGLEETLLAATLLSEPGGATAPPAAKTSEPVVVDQPGTTPAPDDASASATADEGASAEPPASEAEPKVEAGPETEAEPETEAQADAKADVALEASPAPAASTDETWRAVLTARGVRAPRVARVSQAIASMRDAKLPVLDADVSPALAELFPRVMAARHLVDEAIAPSTWSPADIRWTRARRITGVSLALVASIVGLYFGLHEPEGTFTSASDVWAQSPTFATDMAVDGRPETSWLLPDRTTGWLEVRTSPARRVERVVLTNTANAPANDRGTQDYRLEIYQDGELARSVPGRFEWSETPQPVTHEIGMDGVDRVRFVVTSFHRTGAGLAEMDIQ